MIKNDFYWNMKISSTDPNRMAGLTYIKMTHFYQPRFQLVVDNDIISVTFETVPIICHHRRYRFQRVHYAPWNIREQFLGDRFATCALQVQTQILHAQFAAVFAVILVLKFPQFTISIVKLLEVFSDFMKLFSVLRERQECWELRDSITRKIYNCEAHEIKKYVYTKNHSYNVINIQNIRTPCFCTDTFVRCTYILSSSCTLVSYLTVQKRQNPSLKRYALSGRKDVMRTYNRRSNFLLPINRGLSMYLSREIVKRKPYKAGSSDSHYELHWNLLEIVYLDITYESFVRFGLKGVFASRDHFFSLLSLLMRNIPAPCDFPHGFIIHVLCGDLRYSSTNIL